MSSEDIFGIPFNWETLYSDGKPTIRKCSHCKQKGHNRRTCKAFQFTKNICLITEKNCSDIYCNCVCTNCLNYRKYNLRVPTFFYHHNLVCIFLYFVEDYETVYMLYENLIYI